jgi:hypothetical protein
VINPPAMCLSIPGFPSWVPCSPHGHSIWPAHPQVDRTSFTILGPKLKKKPAARAMRGAEQILEGGNSPPSTEGIPAFPTLPGGCSAPASSPQQSPSCSGHTLRRNIGIRPASHTVCIHQMGGTSDLCSRAWSCSIQELIFGDSCLSPGSQHSSPE